MPRPARPRSALALILIGLAIALGIQVPTLAQAVQGPAELVRTANGTVRGKVLDDHREFLGVPYGADTATHRFAAPRPVGDWEGVRDATANGPACPQAAAMFGAFGASSEDCLSVNVFTPPVGTSRARRAPVLVWIYGGAYAVGSNAPTTFPELARRGTVIVGINYRVGPYGFLALPQIAAENRSGALNAGTLDQHLALEWVQRNIGAFGGDRNNVTVAGQSAGGNSVCLQVASPLNRGLFQRAIVMSGGCAGFALAPPSQAVAYRRGLAFAASLRCTDPATALECLRALPPATVNASPQASFTSMKLTFEPVIDGVSVPRSPIEAFRTGQYNHVPMMVGGTHDEGNAFMALLYHFPNGGPATQQQFDQFVTSFGLDRDKVGAVYNAGAQGGPDAALAAVITDAIFACPAAATTHALAATNSRPVYTYEFNDRKAPSQLPDPYLSMSATHGSELSYLMTTAGFAAPGPRPAPQQALAEQMQTMWTAFMANGRPAPAAQWPPVGQRNLPTLNLEAGNVVVQNSFVADHHCDFWAPLMTSAGPTA